MKRSHIVIARRAVAALLKNEETESIADELMEIVLPDSDLSPETFVEEVEENGAASFAATIKKQKKKQKKRTKKKGKTKKKSSKKEKDYAKKYRKAKK